MRSVQARVMAAAVAVGMLSAAAPAMNSQAELRPVTPVEARLDCLRRQPPTKRRKVTDYDKARIERAAWKRARKAERLRRHLLGA